MVSNKNNSKKSNTVTTLYQDLSKDGWSRKEIENAVTFATYTRFHFILNNIKNNIEKEDEDTQVLMALLLINRAVVYYFLLEVVKYEVGLYKLNEDEERRYKELCKGVKMTGSFKPARCVDRNTDKKTLLLFMEITNLIINITEIHSFPEAQAIKMEKDCNYSKGVLGIGEMCDFDRHTVYEYLRKAIESDTIWNSELKLALE